MPQVGLCSARGGKRSIRGLNFKATGNRASGLRAYLVRAERLVLS
jgi:hypothetical protein